MVINHKNPKKLTTLCCQCLLLLLLHGLLGCNKVDKVSLESIDINGPSVDWRDMIFYNDQKGVIVGGKDYEKSSILYTKDGGQTWHESYILNNPDKIIETITIHNDLFIAAGADGKMYFSAINQMDTFYTAQAFMWQRNKSLIFNDKGGLMIAGEAQSFGYLQHLDHTGGYISSDTLSFEPRKIFTYNGQVVLIAGYGAILYSRDYGQQFNFSNATGDFFSDITYHRFSQKYWACGLNGSLWYSINDGQNWVKYKYSASNFKSLRFNAIASSSNSTIFIGGYHGMLFQLTDEKNFKQIILDTTEDVYTICSLNDKLFVAGNNGFFRVIKI